MKQDIFMRIYAVILIVAIIVTSVSTAEIIKVYANEGEYLQPSDSTDATYSEDQLTDYVEEDYQQESDSSQDDYNPDAEPAEDEDYPDPFDYDLACYTPNISLGTVYEGDYIETKQFSVVNVGRNRFPITWEEVDPATAFSLTLTSPDEYLDPGESANYQVYVDKSLTEGTYNATYTFFSANDYRRHHMAVVKVTVKVKKAEPYIVDVTIIPGAVTVPVGKTYKFDVTVSGGYDFDPSVSWSVTGQESIGTYILSDGTLTVGENESASAFAVVATSRQDPSYYDRAIVSLITVDHMVTVKAEPSEGGAVTGGGAIKDGSSCNVSASPNNNYVFKGWYEGNTLISDSKTATFTNITDDKTFVAKFSRKSCYVKTSVSDADAGSISESVRVDYGGRYTITAKANNGYRFEGFVENNKTISTANSIELNNITSDRNIVAVFRRDTCNITVTVNPQDTGKYEGAGRYNKGSKVELKAEAYNGYEFTSWTINGQVVSKDRTYTINDLKNDVNLVANFMKKDTPTYKITSGIADDGGGIIPSGDLVVAEGGSASYSIVARQDYKIKAVMVDGKNIGAVASYTFNNVKGGHTIVASFEKVAVTPAPKADENTSTKSKSVVDKPEPKPADSTAKKTEYNNDTATQGAVPEQIVIEEEISEEIEELDEEIYAEDTFVEADDTDINSEVPETGGIMAKHNLDEDTLRRLISDDAVMPMLKEAFEDGTLQITVNNTYAEDDQETSVTTYYSQPTLVNFQDVISASLTAEEKYQVLTGTPIYYNIDITENTDTIDKETKSIMQKKIGYRPISYFDFLVMKTSNGTSSVISNTPAELEVVIRIPEKYRKQGRKFFIIRNHNGVVDVLKDVGEDSDTITFRTNKFSEYALAYEAVNVNRIVLRFLIVAVASLILALVCFLNLVKYRRRARRTARK